MFKGNKKNQVESNILGLKSTQRKKGYVSEAVAQRGYKKSVVKYLEKFTGKRLYRRLFENKFKVSRLASTSKEALVYLFSCEFF